MVPLSELTVLGHFVLGGHSSSLPVRSQGKIEERPPVPFYVSAIML